ncbi:MAG: DUF1573 domain-containing protein [Planctomycetaceae bacterium]|nr:DUF1573 domain-containing protein [Planctomycetaceae bacterium]MCB9952427.1 DUF1573 domain-containing protein [Planctomycetaceae bacterium]
MSAVLVSSASAQQRQLSWAEKMFSHQEIEFGTIARGAEVYQYVTVENLYKEDVTLSSVGTSCSCANAQSDKRVLKTHEKATIAVKMDTKNHVGKKNSNLDVSVTFDGVHFKSVRVPIHAFIRSDIVVSPDNAGFGRVMAGTGAEKTMDITYAGRSDWKINSVRSGSEFVTADVQEVSRGGGKVKYQLTLHLLPNAPIGNLTDRVTLMTDDQANPEFPLTVDASVEADIVASPAIVNFGDMEAGSQKTVPVVLKGLQPFEIAKIEVDSSLNCFRMKESQGNKTVHVIPLTITAPAESGEYEEVFTVTVPGRAEPFQFKAQVHVGG